MKFSVTIFPDRAARTKTEGAVTLDVLLEHARATKAATKDRLPLIKLARFGNKKSKGGCLRHDANVTTITGVEIDYDDGQVGFDAAVELAEKAGLQALIYTSPSHTPDRPRWRLLCPTSCELPPPHRYALVSRLNGLCGGILARESWTLSQSFYIGAIANAPDHRAELVEGQYIDELDELDLIAIDKPNDHRAAAGEPGRDLRGDADLIRRIVTGKGFHCELTALAARYIGRNVDADTVSDLLRGLMLAIPEDARDERWRARFSSIEGLIVSAREKFAGNAAWRRAVARATHQMIRAGWPGDKIKQEIAAIAERLDVGVGDAHALAGRILLDGSAGNA
jgi:hypothetical protein